MRASDWGRLFLLSILWGSSYFFFQILAGELPPLTVVLGRLGIAAILLVGLAFATGGLPRLDAARWRSFAIVALLSNVLPFVLTAWAEQRIAGGFASVLNGTTPCFTILVARLAGQERVTWNKALGLILGVVGVVLLVGPDAVTDGGSLPAIGALLLAALCFALAGVYGQRFHGLKPLEVATAQLVAGTVIVLPFAIVLDQPWRLAPSPEGVLALFGIAVVATAGAYVLYYRILFAVGATNLLLVTLLMPVTALLLGIAFLGERLTTSATVGTAVIAVSLCAIDGRLLRVRKPVVPA